MPNITKTNGSPAALRKRFSFAKTPSVLELPDLIETQKRSYTAFLQRFVKEDERESKGLQALFKEVFPIYDFKETTSLEFVGYTLSPPIHDLSDCQARGLNYQVRLQARLMCVEREKDEDTGQTRVLDITESDVYLGDIPLMTENGTFIINGSERVIVNQLQRSPGVIFLDKSHATSAQKLPTGQVIPYRGAWIEFEFDSKDCIHVRLDRKKKILATVLLRALGWETDAEILRLFSSTEVVPMTHNVVGRIIVEPVINEGTGEVLLEANTKLSEIEFDRLIEAKVSEIEVLVESDEQELRYLRNTLSRDKVKAYAGGTLQEGALLEIFRTLRPGDAPTRDAAASCLERLFFDGARYDLGTVGRYKLNSQLGDLAVYCDEEGEKPSEEIRVLRKEDIAATLQHLMHIRNGHREVDDLDHLGNRRVRVIGELLENQFRIALLQIRRAAREKLSTTTDSQLKNPKNLVYPKPLMMALREFFGSNQLSQFMQQINPLDELTHKRRISAIGPGGLHRDRATAAVRDVHRTHYGRVCPLETPEGPSIGLIVSLATFARVNPYGFLETPYQRIEVVEGLYGDECNKVIKVPEDPEGIKGTDRYKVNTVPNGIKGVESYKVTAVPDGLKAIKRYKVTKGSERSDSLEDLKAKIHVKGPETQHLEVASAVNKYFSGSLFSKNLLSKSEVPISNINGIPDFVLYEKDEERKVVIAECKPTKSEKHGLPQLLSYLSATKTRFGIFANSQDSDEWLFCENLGRNRFRKIELSQFEKKIRDGDLYMASAELELEESIEDVNLDIDTPGNPNVEVVVQNYFDCIYPTPAKSDLLNKKVEIQIGTDSETADFVMRGSDERFVVVVDVRGRNKSEETGTFDKLICASDAKFGIRVFVTDFKKWKFYERIGNDLPQEIDHQEFKVGVVKELKVSECPERGTMLDESKWNECCNRWKNFDADPGWCITEVIHPECPYKKGDFISDAEYQQALKDYICPVKLDDVITKTKRTNLLKTWDGLETEQGKRITEVIHPECPYKKGDFISDAEYQQALKDYICPVKLDDIVTKTKRTNLLKTWDGLETEQGKCITEVPNPICPLKVRGFVPDTEYMEVCEKYRCPDEGAILIRAAWNKLQTWHGLETKPGRLITEVNHPDCPLKVGDFVSEDEFQQLREKYRSFNMGKVEYLTADAEDKFYIAPADADMSAELLRTRKGEEVLERNLTDVDYIGIAPQQIVGVSAALVPFLEHEDANRALMGANHQRQAVPLICPEAPWVGTGMEHRAARDANAMVIAHRGGVVSSVDAEEILIRTGQALHVEEGEHAFSEMGYDVYKLKNFKRSNSGTCIHQRPRVNIGDVVEAGDVVADGTATEGGELALGRNVLCAYMPWGGHNFEDSILISESLIKNDTFTSIHIEEFEVAARQTKMGDEEITRDIPNMSSRSLSQLDDEGIIRIGSVVGTGSILVGKISPKGESEYGPEEKLLRAIFGEKVKEVKDASAYTRPGVEGVVIDVKVFSRQAAPNNERTVWRQEALRKQIEQTWKEQYDQVRERLTEELRETLVNKELAYPTTIGIDNNTEDEEIGESPQQLDAGDVLTREYLEALSQSELESLQITNSDVTAYIKSLQELASGRITAYTQEKEDALEKLDAGEELKPGVLKLVKVYVATRRPISIGDKMAGRYGNKGVIAKILPEEDMPYLPDGTPVDIVLNPLGVPSRMNVGQILEIHLGLACQQLGRHVASPVFDGATEDEVFEMLAETDLADKVKQTGKSILFDGRTGEYFGQEVTVGYVYFLKLNHLVADKMHARSTGPYSLVTQQPLGGKAQHGGQRLGEMEVWALEAYGAAHTLQEMLTIKSDDVKGRTKIYESIVKGQSPLKPGTPESFNVLVRELQSLGLNVELSEGDPNDAASDPTGLHDAGFPLLHTIETMEPIEDEPPLKLAWNTDDIE